jgi:hypothetical protein
MSIVVRGAGRCLLLTGTCDERNQTKREKELAAHWNGFFRKVRWQPSARVEEGEACAEGHDCIWGR